MHVQSLCGPVAARYCRRARSCPCAAAAAASALVAVHNAVLKVVETLHVCPLALFFQRQQRYTVGCGSNGLQLYPAFTWHTLIF